MANVLIIDDDIKMCEMISHLVRRNRHQADYAHTMADGLKKVTTGQYDVVLSFEVVEHLTCQMGQEYLWRLFEALKPGGIMFVTSIFPKRYVDALKEALRNVFHIHIFTRDQIIDLLGMIGFADIKMLGYSIIKARKRK